MVNSLRLDNVVKKYGNSTALDHITFSLHPGIYGLLGENGAGKSTLLNIITTVLVPDSGSVYWNEEPVTKDDPLYRTALGYMPQQQTLNADFTVIGFLYYIASLKRIKYTERTVNEMIDLLHLSEHKKKKLKDLSGGMRQRVLIAQALLNQPELVLLDEPTAGLDPVERMNLRGIITGLGSRRIVLLATHMTSDVEYIADQIMIMKKGRLLTLAPQQDLLRNTKVFESSDSINNLKTIDPHLKIVNNHYKNGKLYTRFVSKADFDVRVETTLDDVYLDWLG